MPAIYLHHTNPGPGIGYADLLIPDTAAMGAGRLLGVFQPGALSSQTAGGELVKLPELQITIEIQPSKSRITLAVMSSQTSSSSTWNYVSLNQADLARELSFEITFADWRIRHVRIAGHSLSSAA